MAKVLRIPRHDNGASFVLVHVDRSATASERPLDLTLVATEGAAPYFFSLKQSQVSSLKAKNSPCTQSEWNLILQSILLNSETYDGPTELLEGVETVAAVKESRSIEITIRKRTEGITQRLGAFNLSYVEEQEIELFDWCGEAVQSASNLAAELSSFISRFKEQQEMVRKLSAQLEELIAAKASHETELLEKFRDLLNEKKAKIRDQQRLLASAKVDPKKLTAVQASRQRRKDTDASPSRSSKRKAKNGPRMDEDEDGEDDGFEKMDVDADQEPNDSDQQDIETPDEDETETVDEDEDMIIPQKKKPPAANTRQTRGNARKGLEGESTDASRIEAPDTVGDPLKTPPRRELPFTKKNQPQAKPPVQDDEETASEDDEL